MIADIRLMQAISIHAPVRGATQQQIAYDDWRRFQFTPLCEGRQPLQM